jgi:hypothetical protein
MNTTQEKQEPKVITALDVIKNRQAELINEIGEIDQLERELLQQLEALRHKRQLRMFEYDMLDRYDERNTVRITSTSTTTVEYGRHKKADKLGFEDSLKLIMDNAGRPVQLCEIITELEKYGYRWNKYVTAQAYIANSDVVERVSRGFYQLIRHR